MTSLTYLRTPFLPQPTAITPHLRFLTQRQQVSEDTEDVQDDILVTGALEWKHTNLQISSEQDTFSCTRLQFIMKCRGTEILAWILSTFGPPGQ